jgi:hypothetical protein
MQVIVKPLPPKGRHQFSVFPNATKTYGVGISSLTGMKVTGVPADRKEHLEHALGVNLDINSKFWDEYKVVLNDKGMILDLNDPVQELQYYVLGTKSEIAKSSSEIKPQCIYMMYNEENEAIKANKQFDYELSAYSYIKEMSEEERADFLKLFGIRTRDLSPTVIKKSLKEKADGDPKYFVELYEDKNKFIKILVEDCVQYRVIEVKTGAYYFGEDMLGADINLAINKLKTPKNSDLVLAIKRRLEEAIKPI